MGKINGCLKCLFIFFNVVFAIFGALMIYGMIQASHQLAAVGSLGWTWVVVLGVFGISCLGIYAGCSEKPLVIKIFAGFMGVGMIVMMITGIVIAVGRNEAKTAFQSPEVVNVLLQDSATLNELQREVGCCGVRSASDWGHTIPSSCACSSAGHRCIARPPGTSGPNQIYEEPCSNYLFKAVDMVFSIVLGIYFGFAVVALLGLLISFLMIHQIKRHDNPGASFCMKGF